MGRPNRNWFLALKFKRHEWKDLLDVLSWVEDEYPDHRPLCKIFKEKIRAEGIQSNYEDFLDAEDEKWRSRQ